MKTKYLNLTIILSILLLANLYAKPGIQEQRNSIVNECKTYIGTPYKYGGMSRDGIDCSGFVYQAVKDATSIQLPRTARDMYSFVRIIPTEKLQKGDLVFFKTTITSKISHVGVYIGRNQFIHSASDGPTTGVIVSSLAEKYWGSKYVAAGTFFPETEEQEEVKPEKKTPAKSKYSKADNDDDDKDDKDDDNKYTYDKNEENRMDKRKNEVLQRREQLKKEREERLNQLRNR